MVEITKETHLYKQLWGSRKISAYGPDSMVLALTYVKFLQLRIPGEKSSLSPYKVNEKDTKQK